MCIYSKRVYKQTIRNKHNVPRNNLNEDRVETLDAIYREKRTSERQNRYWKIIGDRHANLFDSDDFYISIYTRASHKLSSSRKCKSSREKGRISWWSF